MQSYFGYHWKSVQAISGIQTGEKPVDIDISRANPPFLISALKFMSLCETVEMAIPKQEISRIKEQKELVRLLELRRILVNKLLMRNKSLKARYTFPK